MSKDKGRKEIKKPKKAKHPVEPMRQAVPMHPPSLTNHQRALMRKERRTQMRMMKEAAK